MSRRFMPLSMTWVRPWVRGLGERAGTPRKPSKSGIELLQLLAGRFLHVVVERAAARVDGNGEGAEVLDAELPEALGHELLPVDLLDLLVGQAALAADGAHAVVTAERLGEAHHAGARRRADGDLLVPAVGQLADTGRGVEEERAGEVEWRLDALVEDAGLRAVADADDVAVDRDGVARAQLADLLLGRGEADAVLGHGTAPGATSGSDPDVSGEDHPEVLVAGTFAVTSAPTAAAAAD